MTQQNNQTENTPKPEDVKKPKGWIRWSGLVSFLVLVGIGFAITYLALTMILKSQIEKYASQAWGAQISIHRLDFNFIPLGVSFSGIEVTDPKKPMQNLVSIGHLGASLNLYQLVVGRTVIEDMSLQHLAFNQPRTTSGALVVKKTSKVKETSEAEKSKKDSGFAVPSMIVPKPEEILSRQTFKTSEQADKINQSLNQLNSKWTDLQKQMPNSKVIADYQKRFEALTKGSIKSLADLKAKQAEFEKLQKEVSQKADVIKQGKNLFDKDLPQLQKDVNALQKMPAQDFANLQSTYSLDQNGLKNFTYLVYGDKVRNYTQKGLAIYEKVKPFIEKFAAERAVAEKQAKEKAKRQVGQNIAFLEHDPEPDFIIKRLKLSSELDWGQIQATAKDINFDQSKSRMATLFTVSAQPKTQTTALSIKGQSNWIQPGKGFTEAKISWPNYELKDWAMLKDDSLPLTMKSSKVAVNGKLKITEAQMLQGVVDLDYQKVNFDMGATKSKEVKQYLAPVFDDIHQFTVTSELSGKLFAPSIGARSDLDRKVSSSMNKVLNKQITDAKAQLKKQFDAQMAAQLKPINQKLASLLGDQVQLNGNAKSVDQMLSVSPQQYVDQQKAKYEQQVKAQVEAEKKRMEAEAKKKAEEAVKKEQNKLKNQLLKQFKF
ncbi:TIGR03545 family protein [Hydrogenovibrio kuenenii]|uniref:TIGR03545 family protein n=1 Tax=Hydrogenovibrio kuenenii TaxID=63658 RepID=UPI000464DFE4|nr:TIGR03545 family protein [Hydrogenovibrio kuenenii]